jgi:hypothetical protein
MFLRYIKIGKWSFSKIVKKYRITLWSGKIREGWKFEIKILNNSRHRPCGLGFRHLPAVGGFAWTEHLSTKCDSVLG